MPSGSVHPITTTSTSYDALGNAITFDGPLPGAGDTTVYRFDLARQLAGTVGPDPDGGGPLKHRATRLTHNADGQVTLAEAGVTTGQDDAAWAGFTSLQRVTSTYDGNGRKIADVAAAGGTEYAKIGYGYDALGRVICATRRMDPAQWGAQTDYCSPQTTGPHGPDRVEQRGYDAAGRVTEVASAFGTAAASLELMSYTPNGRLQSVKDGENNLTTYAYDGFDRLKRTAYPVQAAGGGASSGSDYEDLGYDANGNVTSRRLRDGTTIGFAYDALNRVVTKTLPAGEAAVSYSYDLLGRTTAMTRPGDTVTLTYDALGRLTSDAQPHGTLNYQYDLAGRRTQVIWGSDLTVTYDYLTTGEVSAIRENGATSGLGILATYAYDDLGRRTRLTRGNGVVTTYGYDAASRLASLGLDLSGTAQDQTYTFGYNPAGQIAARTAANDLYAWTGHYNVDRPYSVNGLNQLTAAGATALGYDGRGNLTRSGTTTYAYTSENQLKYASGPTASTLRYDAAGRMTGVVNGSNNLYVYDGGNMASQLKLASGRTTLQRRYVWGPGADEAILWYEGTGSTDRNWMVTDERGSVVATTNNAGSSTRINAYDEYGISAPGPGQIRYAGQAWISSIGLSYNKARFYSPTLGRFLQTDPIGYADGMNWYNYTGSDPVNKVDPAGTGNEPIAPAPPIGPDIIAGGLRRSYNTTLTGVDLSSIFDLQWQGTRNTQYETGGKYTPVDLIGVDVAAPRNGSLLRRLYRKIVSDPCGGKGTNEGAGVPAGYDPYDVDEKGSLAALYGHVLPDHDFGSSASVLPMILSAIQTNPAKGSGGSLVYTINTGNMLGLMQSIKPVPITSL